MWSYITKFKYTHLHNKNIYIQNKSELINTVKNYIDITSFKMKGSPDLGQADNWY